MRLPRSLTPALLIAALLVPVSSCASRERVTLIFPPHADMAPEEKPRLDPEALDSEAALDAHDSAVEAWGERRDAAVGNICRWAVGNGARLPFGCPPRPG